MVLTLAGLRILDLVPFEAAAIELRHAAGWGARVVFGPRGS